MRTVPMIAALATVVIAVAVTRAPVQATAATIAQAAAASTINTKEGKTITGVIRGIVVQGKSGPAPGTSGFGAFYYVAKGEQIAAIDEDGVRYAPGTRLRYIVIGQKTPVNDLEVVTMAVALEKKFIAGFDYSAKHGMASVSFDFMDMKEPAKLPLIGEFRNEDGVDRIIPTLVVTTASGSISIPVADIVAFQP